MDPFDRFEFRRKINVQAIIAFVIAVIVATLVDMFFLGHQKGNAGLFEVLIVIAAGGFYYHLRRVV